MHVPVFDLFDRGSGKMPASLVEGALMDSEASVLATFDFLANENVVDDDDENLRYAQITCLCSIIISTFCHHIHLKYRKVIYI